jgi:hypothetical protein
VSRSLWAWTKSCAVGGVRRGFGAIDPSQVQAHHGYERLARTISSLIPLTWVVAASIGMLTLRSRDGLTSWCDGVVPLWRCARCGQNARCSTGVA